jgi:biopolymer transport protein ExbB/TolQ
MSGYNFFNSLRKNRLFIRRDLDPRSPYWLISGGIFGFLLWLTATPKNAWGHVLLHERGVIQPISMILGGMVLAYVVLKYLIIAKEIRAERKFCLPDFPFNAEAVDGALVILEKHNNILSRRFIRLIKVWSASQSSTKVLRAIEDDTELYDLAQQSSYALPRIIVWSIPVMGFIGTVMGIGESVSGFEGFLNKADDIDVLREGLVNVTSGLGTAFDTTFLALTISVIVVFLLTLVERIEQQLLTRIDLTLRNEVIELMPESSGGSSLDIKSVDEAQAGKNNSDGSQAEFKAARARTRQKIEFYKSKREHTLVWRIGKRLHEEVTTALSAWLASEKLLVGLEDSINAQIVELEKSAKKIKKRQVITAVVLFVLVALVAVLTILATVLLALIALGFLVTFLFSSVVSFIKLAREQVRNENRIKAAMSLPEYLTNTRVHCHHEYVRLTSLYEQFLDWAEVVGSVIYQPFGENRISDAAEPYETISDVTCFVVGTPDMNNEAIVGEKQKLRRNLVRRGWLTSLVLQMEQSWKPRYARISGQQTDDVQRPGADAAIQMYSQYVLSDDDTDGITTPRQHFKREVMGGMLSAQLRLAVEDSMRQVLRAGDPTRLLGNVTCRIEGLNNSTPTEFLLPPMLMSPLPSFDNFIRKNVVKRDGSVQEVSYGLAALASFEEPTDDSARTRVQVAPVDERFVLAGFRLDLSREMNPEDVLLVKNSEQPPIIEPPVDEPPINETDF